jgi:hypothetical protein
MPLIKCLDSGRVTLGCAHNRGKLIAAWSKCTGGQQVDCPTPLPVHDALFKRNSEKKKV